MREVSRRCGTAVVWLVAGAGFAMGAAGMAQAVGGGMPLGAQIAGLLADPGVVRAHWGIDVAGMDGVTIYQLNDGQFFQPASNAKLFTTAAALAVMGVKAAPEVTVLAAKGRVQKTELQGDLVVFGEGDANLSGEVIPYVEPTAPMMMRPDPLRHLEEMADLVVSRGIRRVEGDVVGDDTLFVSEPYGADWAADDLMWGYGAPVSALSVNDNQIKVTVTPGVKSGEPAGVRLEPDVPYYSVEATAMTGARGSAGAIRMDRALGTKVLTVSGAIAVGAPALVEEIAIGDPAEYAAIALKQMLEARGVVVTGTARAQHRPGVDPRSLLQVSREPLTGPLPLDLWDDPARLGRDPAAARGLTTLMDVGGGNLGDDVVVTNKLSLNLHAEVMLRQLGYFAGGDGSAAQGARVVRAFVLQAGVDPGDFVFYDGSGLSGHDLVTPRAVVKLLQYAAGQPWFPAYRASLPVGGVDGSLVGRFAQSPVKGHVFAKTGTLGEARALSGYLECASGRTVTFSVMVTDHAPGTSEDRVVMDKIVEAIWAAN